jgi:putative acetyltransferase
MHIRRVFAGEEAALYEIFYSAIHLIACRDYTEEQLNAWAPAEPDIGAWAKRIQSMQPFVAQLNGKPLGYASIQSDGYIDHFFVSGHYPRQGIAKALMAKIESEAERLAIPQLSANASLTAQPFFARCGFKIIEQGLPVVRGVALANALMQKER